MDVDDFKKVNDGYGHAAGDAALKHVSAIIRQKCRTRDKLYRISGDEFGVILPDTSEEEAFGVMRRVVSTLHDSHVIWTSKDGSTKTFGVSLSIGVAECTDARTIKAAFEAADKASYDSKKAGKARVSKATSPATDSNTETMVEVGGRPRT